MAGAPLQLALTGGPPGVRAVLLMSLTGVGDGPCHPAYPDDLCVDLLAPRSVASSSTDRDGSARFSLRIPDHADGLVQFQVALLDASGPGVSTVVEVPITRFDVTWPAVDLLELRIEEGESGYDFGIAETFAGDYGWYGEDCYLGTGPTLLCHPAESRGLMLESVHPDVGGAGIPDVIEGESTLFYDIHHPYVTYFLRGWDSGECWAFGDDPTYYEDAYGCEAL